jgi:hypothetical protein
MGATDDIMKMAKENNISAQLIMQKFMYERLLERIVVSQIKTTK